MRINPVGLLLVKLLAYDLRVATDSLLIEFILHDPLLVRVNYEMRRSDVLDLFCKVSIALRIN